ncbi:uncharacterized protein LOC118348654 [Juglans regia]|uniref:Uncharacterized protein LOC118348654 n=1 Tax=Juglans regia TaxID=51240 RepID=A0A6P9EGL4_JUGRE|nr:uncharacterized protein LOC118348654 [Juglans regia]
MRQFVETMCNGEFFNKEPEEAFEYFDYLSENAQSWDTADSINRHETSRHVGGGGKYTLRDEDDLPARLALISKKLETIELKKVNEVQVVPRVAEKCGICEDQGHSTNECPTIPAFKEVLLGQTHNVNMVSKPFSRPYSNTSNARWRNHPNFSWRGEHSNVLAAPTAGPANFAAYGAHPGPSYVPHPSQSSQFSTQPAQAPKKGLEDTVQQLSVILQQFMQGQATLNNQNSLAINDIRTSITRLTTSLYTQEKGKFPAQSQPNPQGQPHQVQAVNEDPNLKLVKAVTTLRSGKVVDIPAHEPYNSGKVSNPSKKDGKHVSDEHEKIDCPIPAPFPQQLVPLHKDKHHAEILEVFRQVRINIPLLYAIQQIPAYAKFLKDLCTVKRRLNVHKKAFLTEQLGLGELKSTPIIWQLANRSIKMPRGIVEDVLVQVDKFYYPVGFVVLDMKLSSPSTFQAPIILGRPFLATSNALINCRSRILKLSFENKTLELNIFNTCRQPRNLEEVQEVNLLENILDEDFYLNLPSTDLQLSLEGVLSDLNIFDDTSNVSFAGIGHCVLWQPKFEELPPLTTPIKPSSNVILDMDLKPLPTGLKYIFLGLDNTFPVVIYSTLTLTQEEKLIEVLKKHKGQLGGQ